MVEYISLERKHSYLVVQLYIYISLKRKLSHLVVYITLERKYSHMVVFISLEEV